MSIIKIKTFRGVVEDQVNSDSKDLLLQLLEKMIKAGNPPDILSKEEGNHFETIIRFEWHSGKSMEFPYTDKRIRAVWTRFTQYWREQ
jgi:hypothetical protein